MKLFLAFVEDLYTVFDPAVHTDMDNDGLMFDFHQAEGEAAEIRITRENQGFAILQPGTPQNVLISQSLTGEPEDAQLIARGRITGMPDGIFEFEQTITVTCAPVNLAYVDNRYNIADGPLLQFARANLASMPETMPYLSDYDRNDPQSYLLGRTQVYHIDPATHEVTVSHLATGDRLVNLADAHPHDTDGKPQTSWGERPVPRARLKILASWLQQGTGLCDISGSLKGDANGPIKTLSPDFLGYVAGDFPNGLSDAAKGSGWTIETESSRVKVKAYPTREINSGRSIDALNAPSVVGDAEEFWTNHPEIWRLTEYAHDFQKVFMRYDYSADREETAWLVLTQPIQTTTAVELDLDEGELTTIELTADLTAIPWEAGQWFEGERCQYGWRVYECLQDHTSLSFYHRTDWTEPGVVTGHRPSTFSNHPMWKEVESTAAVATGGYEFLTTDLGKKVIAHGFCRLQKALTLRNRALTVTAEYTWLDAHDVTLKDSVRMEVPWPDGTSRAIIGKVIAIDKTWDDIQKVTLTLGVSVGTGVDDVSDNDLTGVYNTDGYFPVGYLRDQSPVDGHQNLEFVMDAEASPRPINVDFLKSHHYAVRNVRIDNEAPVQLSRVLQAVIRGENPLEAIKPHQTKIRMHMRDLATEGVFKRTIYCAGEMLSSPRGIDLVTGGDA